MLSKNRKLCYYLKIAYDVKGEFINYLTPKRILLNFIYISNVLPYWLIQEYNKQVKDVSCSKNVTYKVGQCATSDT